MKLRDRLTDEDLERIARYLYVKHDPWFNNRNEEVVDAEGDHVILCIDESDAMQMAAAMNRLTGHP